MIPGIVSVPWDNQVAGCLEGWDSRVVPAFTIPFEWAQGAAMSGDEVMVLVVSIGAAALAWLRWYAGTRVSVLAIRNAARSIFVLAPVACLAVLLAVLRLWAADDVRYSAIYLAFYAVMGAAWVGSCTHWLGLFGISQRDDVIERQNLPAALVIAGALAGTTFCFAGANIGNGPGWWVVVFSAGLSTLAFFGLWALVEWLTGVSESVTVGRLGGAGLRLGGFLAATGMILGRAAAGDWVSAQATVQDLVAVGWPVLPLAVLAMLVERLRLSDTDAHEEGFLGGVFVAAVYLAVACLYVFVWQGQP